MADDKSKKGQQDRSRVNSGEDYEVRYEAKKEGVSTDEVRQAVKDVGNSREKVERKLKDSK